MGEVSSISKDRGSAGRTCQGSDHQRPGAGSVPPGQPLATRPARKRSCWARVVRPLPSPGTCCRNSTGAIGRRGFVVTNRSVPRLEEIRDFHQRIGADIPLEYHHTPQPGGHRCGPGDAAARVADHQCHRTGQGCRRLTAHRPGRSGRTAASPGTSTTGETCCSCRKPAHSRRPSSLQIEDGWIYFLHGWTRVIAEVFHIDIPTSGPDFDALSRIAADART